MAFNFPEEYKGFKRKKDTILTLSGWEEYQKGLCLLQIKSSKIKGFQVAANTDIDESCGELDILDVFKTIEDAWEYSKKWMEKQSLRAELQRDLDSEC